MGLFRTVSEINGDFSRKSQIKTSDGATGPRRTFDDILSRLGTIHERDRQTDEQTLADSKDSAYT